MLGAETIDQGSQGIRVQVIQYSRKDRYAIDVLRLGPFQRIQGKGLFQFGTFGLQSVLFLRQPDHAPIRVGHGDPELCSDLVHRLQSRLNELHRSTPGHRFNAPDARSDAAFACDQERANHRGVLDVRPSAKLIRKATWLADADRPHGVPIRLTK